MKRLIRLFVPTTVMVLALAAPALGGGVTVVSFTEIPSDFEAGTPYRLDYSILGHGVEPMSLGESTLRFHGPGGEIVSFSAESTAKGQWTAEVILPTSGEWRWEVVSGSEVLQTLGTMSVAPPEAVPADAMPGRLMDSLRVGLPIATLLALILLVTEIRSRIRRERQPSAAADVA